VSSRDRLNRLENSSSRSRVIPSSEPGEGDDVDRDFWDIDPEEPERYAEDEPVQAPRSRMPRRTRVRASSSRGTAHEIDRLRNNLGQAGGRERASQPSPGRNSLARPSREPVPVDEDDVWDDEKQDWPQPATSGRTRTERDTAPRDRSRGADTWLDSDEDDRYYDDDDDFDEYDAPARRTPLTRAPTIRLSRQRVSRPAMPSIISRADLINDAPALGLIGLALVSLAGMAIVVANSVDSLAPSFATHVSASGVLEDIRGSEALWHLPLLAAMLTLMNIGAAWFISSIDRFASRFLIAAAIIVQFVAWVALLRIL